MRERNRVCVVGSFMADLVVRAPRRPAPGETLIGTSFNRYLGGKGFNQAVAAARSGAATSVVGRLGDDDFAADFRRQLAVDGVDAAAVTTDAARGTGVATPLVEDGGENSIVIVPRANHAMSVADVEAAAPVITAASVLLLQLELPLDVSLAAARLAKDAGLTVVLNPAPAGPDLSGFAGVVDVVTPNEPEARQIAGAGADTLDALAKKVAIELDAAIVMTLGADGALLIHDGAAESFPAHVVDVVDTVGAGDAFCGVLGAALSEGADLYEAARRGNAAGALAVTRDGAEPSMPARAEVEALLAR